jgi:7-cyano-7-deazaguanine synthase
MKALVIFSGGLDSTTCLGWAKNRYEEVEAISFIYGQKNEIEIEQAKKIVEKLNVKHTVIDVSFFSQIVDSALTSNGDVNKEHSRIKELPSSFVPNRNAFFITLSHAYAQKIGAEKIITGVCQTDYSGYPDCRDVFIKLINVSLNIGSQSEIEIITPMMWLTKKETWELAEKENVIDLVKELSHTCYEGSDKRNEWGRGCGECPACILRYKGYYEYIKLKKEM